jgi:nucleoside-diphosphate-sugar epimerase
MYDQERVPDQVALYPRSIYGACKALNERMAHHYGENMGVDSIGLRFPIVYGPGRLRGAAAFTSRMLESAALGEPFTIPYAGENVINWLYAEDAAQSIFLACGVKRTEARVFNVSGDVRTVDEAIRCVQRLVPEAKLIPGEGSIGFVQKYDQEGIERQLGYKPRFCIEEGFRETLDHLRKGARHGPGIPGFQEERPSK